MSCCMLGYSATSTGGAATWGAITGTLSAQADLQTALNAKEGTITAAPATSTDYYWQGDKTWALKSGLPISTATQTALDAKVDNTDVMTPAQGGFGVTMIRSASTSVNVINDFSPTTGWTEFTGTGADITLTGIVAAADGVFYRLTNTLSSGRYLKLVNASSGSSLANRFSFASDIYLARGESIELVYNASQSRWNVASQAGSWSTFGNVLASGTMTIGNTNAGSISLQGKINGATWMDMSGADRKFYGQSSSLALSFGSVGRKAYNTSSQETLDWENGLTINPSTGFATSNWISGYHFDVSGLLSADTFLRTLIANDGGTSNIDYSEPSSRLRWVKSDAATYSAGTFTNDMLITGGAEFAKGNGSGGLAWALYADGSATFNNLLTASSIRTGTIADLSGSPRFDISGTDSYLYASNFEPRIILTTSDSRITGDFGVNVMQWSAAGDAIGFLGAIPTTAAFAGDEVGGALGAYGLMGSGAYYSTARIQGINDKNIPFFNASQQMSSNSKFVFDYTNVRMGLGFSAPNSKLHIDSGTATASDIRFTAGATTGQTTSDGFQLGITAAGVAEIRQREAQALELYTSNVLRAQWTSAGNLFLDGSTQARGGAGSAAVPFWGFTSSSDCGMYRGAGSTLGLSTSGVSRLLISTAGQWDFFDGTIFNTGGTTGLKIGNATTNKLGFHNATPTIQRAGAAQDAVATTAATNVAPYGFTTAAQADSIITLLNEIRAALVEKGLIKGSV